MQLLVCAANEWKLMNKKGSERRGGEGQEDKWVEETGGGAG